MSFDGDTLGRILAPLPRGQCLRVAYSGGVDSHSLLHALGALRLARPDLVLGALHVHHGLSPNADRWADHCRATCDALGIPCEVIRVRAAPGPGESPEAAARAARYAAFAARVETGDWLLTAHHCDDQAETLLLQLLRGAGVRGLAAMARSAPFGAGRLLRPLLDFTRAEIEAYARRHRLVWIEDESNLDPGFDRNLLRQEIMPRLRARWPAAATTIARSASHCAEAQQLLDELAREDLRTLATEDPAALSVPGLAGMLAHRQRNVLRHWIVQAGHDLPDTRVLERIIGELIPAAPDALPCVAWSDTEVRRYRSRFYLMRRLKPHDPAQIIPWDDLSAPLHIDSIDKTLRAAEVFGGGGIELVHQQGLSVTIRFRRGGERCRLPGKTHHQELKKLFQERGVPPWLRERIPLIHAGEQLVAVVGYFDCAWPD